MASVNTGCSSHMLNSCHLFRQGLGLSSNTSGDKEMIYETYTYALWALIKYSPLSTYAFGEMNSAV